MNPHYDDEPTGPDFWVDLMDGLSCQPRGEARPREHFLAKSTSSDPWREPPEMTAAQRQARRRSKQARKYRKAAR
jgi:hypothetical protein